MALTGGRGTAPAGELPEADPEVLRERIAEARAELVAAREGWGPEDWRRAAREQLLLWLEANGLRAALGAHFRDSPREHGLSPRTVFRAFMAFEPEGTREYFEVPFLMAVLDGEREAALAAARELGLGSVPEELFRGPFPPFQVGALG